MLTSKNFYLAQLLSPIAGIAVRWKRSRLRHVIRGHRVLRKNGNLDLIATIQAALTETPIDLSSSDCAPLIFGAATGEAERVVRQYLLLRIGGLGLNATLLRALALPKNKIAYPLPSQWRSILEAHGFNVSHWRCEILWHLYLIGAWGYGILQILRSIVRASITKSNAGQLEEKYVYFVDLGRGNLPQNRNGAASYDVISWYLKWAGRDLQIKSVRHGVSGCDDVALDGVFLRSQPVLIPPMRGLRIVFRYLIWTIKACFVTFASLMLCRWWNVLLLNQAVTRAHVAILPDETLAAEYFFHNSGWLYRPLWTYELEGKNSGCSIYFYSTNCERFKNKNGYPSLYYGYGAMNWPRYLVWDDYQADFVRRAAGDASRVLEVGPIWFSSCPAELPTINRTRIALFDVTPFRHSKFCGLGLDNLFYTPEVASRFIEDVLDLANAAKATVLWKRKRNVGKHAHPSYRKFAETLVEGEALRIIDPDLSAFRVVIESDMVISMPFTSTALIARSLGIPSVYYDPCGMVQRDDRAAHGIDVLIGREELEKWVNQLLSTKVEQ